MAGPFETQIGIGVKDNASAAIRRIRTETQRMQQAREQLGIRSERSIQREIDRTAAAYLRLARSGSLSAAEQSRAFDKMTSTIDRLNREMGLMAKQQERISRNPAREAYAALGIRSEQSVQREIARTIAAYNRLERSGVLSASEQRRAYEQMTSTVSKLRRELGETERTQGRMATTFKTMGMIGGAVAGVGLALRKPVAGAASYDAELRRQANFAYSDSDFSGREKGMERINQVIKSAVDSSGASPDEAFSGMETMMRSGVVSREQAYKFLPYVLRNAVATGADAASVANTQASAVNFGLSDKDAPAALSVLTTMAQHGRIDVPELAREMPRGLEAGKSAGFYGKQGFSQLAAFFEASAIGAKDPQDAATNANDFLAELTANNLATNGKRIKINGKGLDIRSMMRNDLAHGKTALDTVTGIIGKMDDTDPAYLRLQKQLASASTDQEREGLNARISQIHGQHISQLFPNQQARNAYINFDRNRSFFNKQVNEGVNQFGLPDGQRSADLDFKIVADGPQWKTDRARYNAELVSDNALKGASGVVGNLMNYLADLEKEFPELAEVVSGTTTAFQGILGGIGGSVLGGWLGSGGITKAKGWLSKTVTGAGEVAEDSLQATEKYGGKLLKLGKLGALGDVMMAGNAFYSEFLERGQDKVAGTTPNSRLPQPVGALDMWDEIHKWLTQSDNSHPASKADSGKAGINTPVLPPINIYLDGTLMTQHILQQAEFSNRRHGA